MYIDSKRVQLGWACMVKTTLRSNCYRVSISHRMLVVSHRALLTTFGDTIQCSSAFGT